MSTQDCKCSELTKLAVSVRVTSILSYKYGHFWLQKCMMATVKMPYTVLQNRSPHTMVLFLCQISEHAVRLIWVCIGYFEQKVLIWASKHLSDACSTLSAHLLSLCSVHDRHPRAHSQRLCWLNISCALNSVYTLAWIGIVYVNEPQNQQITDCEGRIQFVYNQAAASRGKWGILKMTESMSANKNINTYI